MYTGTIYDVTAKEYMTLGKIGDKFFTTGPTHEQIIQFLTRISYGNQILVFLDSKGEPERFYDDGEFEKWKEIEPKEGETVEWKHKETNATSG
jgi:hypothetical protein